MIVGTGYGRVSLPFIDSKPVSINSMCTVFAESEIIGLLAQEVSKEAIASGIVQTIATKMISLASRIPCLEEITFSGGVANNPEICELLSAALGFKFVCNYFQCCW